MPRRHAAVIRFLNPGGVVCAGAPGWLWPSGAAQVGFAGDLVLNGLRMMIIPLVVAAVICGVAALGDVCKFGRPGAMAAGHDLATSVAVGAAAVDRVLPAEAPEQSGDAP